VKKLVESGVEVNADIFTQQAEAFKELAPQILPTLKNKFGNFSIVSTEKEINEPLRFETEEYEFIFTGFIDCIIETEDGKYHIIDWKTCKNPWSDYKRKDYQYLNQLLLYKHFFIPQF